MKNSKLKAVEGQSSYEVERDLRAFSSLTSEGLSTLLSVLYAEVEEATESEDILKKQSALKNIKELLDQALFLSRNLRYFSKASGNPTRTLDVSHTVLQTLDGLEEDFKLNRIELGAFVESGIYARIDAGALEQILSNLLLHSIASMPSGGKLTVALGKNGKNLEFCISDTGLGLRPDQMDLLFNPYYATHSSAFFSKDRGLGLVVSKALIEAEGGKLTVRSTLGKGTNFIFTLPYDEKLDKPEPFLQKRRFERIQITLPVEVKFGHGEPFLSRLTTLSTGGCFIELLPEQSTPHKNTLVSLTVYSIGKSPIVVENARVANSTSTGSGLGLGIEFPSLDDKTRKILSSIVKGHR